MNPDTQDGGLEFKGFSSTSADIPEEVDDINAVEGQPASHTFSSPPRIADRYCRSNANPRRRSSAASSRRTSISSSHSHHSGNRASLRAGAGCQSNHVAQHLRRASIIESRKARLQDRAAHAEQVRLRAALAKAAPPPRASSSEERAQAAQLAREKHLAQVAAVCAEEVRRSKKVAEDMKERKAAEEQKNRLEIKERQAEAERRRLEYMKNTRRPRTASVPAPETKRATVPSTSRLRDLDRDTAVLRIQRAWRHKHRKNTVERFLSLGLSIDQVHDTDFVVISGFLAEDKSVMSTMKLLSLFRLLDISEDAAGQQTTSRTFLSAYLILGHPTSVLSNSGDQEQDLMTKAKDLLISFESGLFKLCPSNGFMPTDTFLQTLSLAHAAYVSAFQDWKARDSSTLIETMVASFVGLDAIWQTVKDDTRGGVADEYKQGIRDNQVLLLSKIRKLAGPERANLLIKKGIRESRRSRVQRRRPGEVRPRMSEQAASSNLSQPIPNAVEDVCATSAPSESDGRSPTIHKGSLSGAINSLFSSIPPNRILVHELYIDKEFRIDTLANCDLRTALYRDICDSMRDAFERGEGNGWTVAVATNIRSRLLGLLRPGQSLHTLIKESLDTELIHRQCQQGSFSYSRFFKFMASILPKLCAPFRDNHVKALATELESAAEATEDGSSDLSSMLGMVFKILQTIDFLSMDHSNFYMHMNTPVLIREAPAYERQAFGKDIETGKISLDRMRRWWRKAIVNAVTEVDRRDPLYGNPPSKEQIYARALVDLALAPSAAAARNLKADEVPETLEMDLTRLTRMREHSLRIATVGAILLTAKNLLKRDVRSAWKTEATRMWEILSKEASKTAPQYASPLAASSAQEPPPQADIPTRLLSAIESSHALPPQTRTMLLNTITRLINYTIPSALPQPTTNSSSSSSSDPVLALLHRRLRTHVLGRVAAFRPGERVKAATNASTGLAAAGLAEFASQVTEMVEILGKVGELDLMAHSTWYEEVAQDLGSETESREDGPTGQAGQS